MEWIETANDYRKWDLFKDAEKEEIIIHDSQGQSIGEIFKIDKKKEVFLIFKIHWDRAILNAIFTVLNYRKTFDLQKYVNQENGNLVKFIKVIQHFSGYIVREYDFSEEDITKLKLDLKRDANFLNSDTFVDDIISQYKNSITFEN